MTSAGGGPDIAVISRTGTIEDRPAAAADGRIIKIVPKKFKENFELHFRDLISKGAHSLTKRLVDQHEEKRLIYQRQKQHAEELMRGGRKVEKPFDLVEIENMAFNKLYVGPTSSHDIH